MRRTNPKHGERGFAMLIVFLMAAAIAIMLYQQMPRVAFESEREKEQLLQDRGLQYTRAVQMYYTSFRKWPSKVEDLENTNNKRFLRRRYIDPMTGKDEWRFIHANAAGQLTDSLVTPLQQPNANGQSGQNGQNGQGGQNSSAGGFGNNAFGNNSQGSSGMASSPFANPSTPGASGSTDTGPDVNSTVLRRPSDRSNTPLPGTTPPPDADPNDPRYWAPITILTPQQIAQQSGQQPANGQQGGAQQTGQQQFPGQQYPGQPLPGQQPTQGQTSYLSPPAVPGLPQYPGQPPSVLPGGYQPGLPGQTPINNQGIGVPGSINPTGGTYSGAQAFGGQLNPNFPGGASTPQQSTLGNATAGINDSLRTQQTPTAPGGPIGTAGIVGVASTFKGASIKVYKERQKYQEWEFVFDLKSLLPGGGSGQPGLGQGAPTGTQNPTGQPGMPGSPTSGSSPFTSPFPTTPTTPSSTTVH